MDYYTWAVAELFLSPTALEVPKLHLSNRQKEVSCLSLHLVVLYQCIILLELPLNNCHSFLLCLYSICLNIENLNHI